MRKNKGRKNRSETSSNSSVQIGLSRYGGLDLVETNQFVPTQKTEVIGKWVLPLGPERPMIRLDFPAMGYVAYQDLSVRTMHGKK